MDMDEWKQKFRDEVRKELIVRQRLLWMEKGKARVDFGDLAQVVDHVANFYNMAPNLLDADDEKFERWFEKLYRLDKRILAFWIVAEREKMTEGQWEFAKDYYDKRNEGIDWEMIGKVVK